MIATKNWLMIKKEGLYCIPGEFFIDPRQAVSRAIITHAHSDHAVSGHAELIAHHLTIDMMKIRYGEAALNLTPLSYYERLKIKNVEIYLLPAGHILGSAQIVIEYAGLRAILSGDFKRAVDPTCPAFIVEPCDIFITEATFALPVFSHPPIELELGKLLNSLHLYPHRCHLVGVYALGKCQRLIKTLRILGYSDPIYIHESLKKFCDFYESIGIELGPLITTSMLDSLNVVQGNLLLCPPNTLHSTWSRRFANVLNSMASGWMQIRARAKQKGIELPLIISDHADWTELTQTIQDINPKELWITHGREEALIYYAQKKGYQAQALSILGYEGDED